MKWNQAKLRAGVEEGFEEIEVHYEENRGHGRIEKRRVSICRNHGKIVYWKGLQTIIRVESSRQIRDKTTFDVRWYISDLEEDAKSFSARIRGHWQVENKLHHVNDVTQGEDASRIRKGGLPLIFSSARKLALNLYRAMGFKNMAQAQRCCGYELTQLLALFSVK